MSVKRKVQMIKRHKNTMPEKRVLVDSPVLNLQRGINRMFDNFFAGFSLGPVELANEKMFIPKVNVMEGLKEVRVTAELPGLAEKDMEVSISRGRLALKGEKRTEKEDQGKNFHYLERSSGSFYREIPLPENTDPDKAQAIFKNGVLTVTLPKLPGAKEDRKKIPIKNERK